MQRTMRARGGISICAICQEEKRLQDGPQLARRLEQILDRDSRLDVGSLSRERDGDLTDGLPRDRELIDSFNVNGQTVQLRLEHQTLRSGIQVWLVASESIDWIPKLAATTSDSPIEKHLPPQFVDWKLMDTSLWRWLAMALLAVILIAFSRWISRLAIFIADALLKRRTAWKIDRVVLHTFSAPLQLLLPAVMFRMVTPALGLSALLRLVVNRALVLLVFLSVGWLCIRVVDVFILGLQAVLVARKSSFSYSAVSLGSRILKLTILIFAVIAVLGEWGYNTSTVLASLGVGGIALALAAQKTIENLFGSVAVISDRPIAVGDYCKFGDRAGTVEDIGLRSTRIRTIDRTLVTVPNGVFSAMEIENFNRRDKMLFHITLNLRRDTMPEQVRAILQSVGKTLTGNPKIEAGATPVRFIGIGTYSLDLEIFVYILTMNGDEFLKMQQELLLTILDQVAEAGTALALPTQASINYSPAGPPDSGSELPAHNGRR
jgi:MscS family membrane protein